MLNDTQLRDKLFDFMFELLISHGGDGDIIYKGSQWEQNSNLFEEWSNKHHPNYLKRSDHEKYVTFHNDQESIYFADNSFEFGYGDVIHTERV